MSDRDRDASKADWVDTTAGSSPDPAAGKGPFRGLPPPPDVAAGDVEDVDIGASPMTSFANGDAAPGALADDGANDQVGVADGGEVKQARRPTTER
jgi:hypothetical protein